MYPLLTLRRHAASVLAAWWLTRRMGFRGGDIRREALDFVVPTAVSLRYSTALVTCLVTEYSSSRAPACLVNLPLGARLVGLWLQR